MALSQEAFGALVAKVQAGELTQEAALQTINASNGNGRAKQGAPPITFRPSKDNKKGVLCAYGLGVRPWPYYLSQWGRMLEGSSGPIVDKFFEAVGKYKDTLAMPENFDIVMENRVLVLKPKVA